MTAEDFLDIARMDRDDEIDASPIEPEPDVVLDHDGAPHQPIVATSNGETLVVCDRCALILEDQSLLTDERIPAQAA